MPRRHYSNTAAQTTLTGSITDSSTSLTVASASNYPTTPFTIAVDSEVILVGGTTGTTFNTLTRGYDGTVAASHSTSTAVEHRAIAEDFRTQWIDVITNDDTETIYDDEFDDDDDSGWTQVTPTGTATWTEARGKLSVLYSGQTASDCCANLTSLNGLSYPLYTVTAMRSLSANQNYNMRGLVFTNGTTSTSSVIWLMPFTQVNTSLEPWSLRSGTLTNISTTHFSSNVRYQHAYGGWAFQRLDWISTNTFQAWASVDGVSWINFGFGTYTPSITPTHYGLGVSTWGGSGACTSSFEMFRVYTSKPSYWQEL